MKSRHPNFIPLFLLAISSLSVAGCSKGAGLYYLGKEVLDNPDSLLSATIFGAIAGALCGVPSLILLMSKDKAESDNNWWPIVVTGLVGALGGLLLGIPAGIILFVVLTNKVDK